jgi:hypothetical protein
MLDITKPVKTYSGYPVKLIYTERKGDFPLVGLLYVGGEEKVATWTADGRKYGAVPGINDMDLVNCPENRRGWVNIYKDEASIYRCMYERVYFDEGSAIKEGSNHPGIYVASVPIEWED